MITNMRNTGISKFFYSHCFWLQPGDDKRSLHQMMFVQDWEGTEPRDAHLIITNDPSINININFYINIDINDKVATS